jgi:hypothetical protein
MAMTKTKKPAKKTTKPKDRAEKAEEMLRQARTDRDREAFDRQTAQDAWNDMRRQRDAALVRAETAERFVAHADSGWKARAEKAERERDEWKARHDTLADVSRKCIATAERERDARPDISAEDAAHAVQFFRGWDAPGSVTDKVFAALRAHAAKAGKP